MKIILGQVLNSDFNISSEKIVNAFNIALFENHPLSKDLLELFLNQESETKKI